MAKANSKKILVSGVKPTGRPHIGNYFGAMRQFVELQTTHEPYVFIADLHALTTAQDPVALKRDTLDMALDYLAIGLNPKTTTLFKQSDTPEVTELAWYFNCITTVPYLERAHAYKDANAKGREVSVGTFDYPMLMAADIVIHDADVVPVGQDQKQHVEYARDTVEKFNRLYDTEALKMPQPLILSAVETVPGTDGRKMSKSYDNTIPLFSTDKEIADIVMKILTDSDPSGEPKNVRAIHNLLKPKAELDALYEKNRGKYKPLKEALIADLQAFIKPLRERREELAKNIPAVEKILQKGGEKARAHAQRTLDRVRKAVGIA